MTSSWFKLLFALLLTFGVVMSGSSSSNAEYVNSHNAMTNQSMNAVMNIQTTVPSLSLRRRTARDNITVYTTEIEKSQSTSKNNQHERRTKDVEEILNRMAHKDPSQWEPTEWIVFLLFISLFGWIACCLFTMCCCGRGSSNLLGWLCLWEICCRDGRDLDACCDTYICR